MLQQVPLGFNPRGPCGPRQLFECQRNNEFLVSIHAARVDRDNGQYTQAKEQCVSIHAARVDRDIRCACQGCSIEVSIHAARVDRDWSA